VSPYTLTAKLGTQVREHLIDGSDQTDATMSAIVYILNQSTDDQVWAKGEISLTDADGNLLHHMDPKV
jgi:hypothetical protein